MRLTVFRARKNVLASTITICGNVTETLSWIFEEIPTEDFVSSEHLGLKDLDALIGEAPK